MLTMGFGLLIVSSAIRVPRPPAKMTTFMPPVPELSLAIEMLQSNFWTLIFNQGLKEQFPPQEL
jgi:hypothetical protein